MKPMFFASPKELRKWFEKNHKKEKELLLGFYKVDSGKPSVTWPESVDEALCFGWIDGIRKSIDKHSYTIRFTPRKPTSIWSAVNIDKMEELIKKGLVLPEGLASYRKRKENKSRVYAYENAPVSLSPAFEEKFKSNKKAWSFFLTLPPSYQKVASRWVMSAKQEETRIKRLGELISDSEAGLRIKPLRYGAKKYD